MLASGGKDRLHQLRIRLHSGIQWHIAGTCEDLSRLTVEVSVFQSFLNFLMVGVG